VYHAHILPVVAVIYSVANGGNSAGEIWAFTCGKKLSTVTANYSINFGPAVMLIAAGVNLGICMAINCIKRLCNLLWLISPVSGVLIIGILHGDSIVSCVRRHCNLLYFSHSLKSGQFTWRKLMLCQAHHRNYSCFIQQFY